MKSSSRNYFAYLRLLMVTATITLVGFVGFRILDAQTNTEIAESNNPNSSKVATIESPEDIDTVTQELESTELDSLDSELDAEFNF